MAYLAAALPYIYAAAAAATAYGVYSSNEAIAANNRAQAQAADYNAKMQEQNAQIARNNAAAQSEEVRQQQRQMLAKQRAAAAQSGLDPGYGSLGLVQQQSADTAELDAQMIMYKGELEARGYSSQSVLDAFSGRVSNMNARSANRSAYVGATAALLNGASNYGASSLRINGPGSQ